MLKIRWLPACCAVLLLLSGCPINKDRDVTAPTVDPLISPIPSNQAINVDPDTTITVTFSEAMNASTFDTNSFYLSSGSGVSLVKVPGNISVSGKVATFVPSVSLSLSTDYTVSITTAVQDLAGNPLQVTAGTSKYTLSFSTRAQIWHSVLALANSTSAATPKVDMSTSGVGAAIWVQSDGTRKRVYADLYDNVNKAWLGAQLVDSGGLTPGVGDAETPKIFLDDNNMATALWLQADSSTRKRVYVSRMDLSTRTWGTPTAISTNSNGDAQTPDLAISRVSGEAMAVWTESDGTRLAVRASYFDGTSPSWAAPLVIDAGVGDALEPKVAMNSLGEAIAAWREYDGSGYHIYAAQFDSSGWGAVQRIDAYSGNAAEVQVCINDSGYAAATWSQHDGLSNSIYANIYYSVGKNWSNAYLVDVDNFDAKKPSIAINASARIMVVWQQDTDIGTVVIARKYAPVLSWQALTQLSIEDDTEAVEAQVAVDKAGDFLAVWAHGADTERQIYSSRYDGDWRDAERISENTASNRTAPQIAMDLAGNAISIWLDSAVGIRVNHYR